MHYELWDTVSHNLLDDFASEAEAFAAVAALVRLNGTAMAESLTLLRLGGPAGDTVVARGAELLGRARANGARRGRQPA
jgi:hypothetical protein